MIRIFLLSLAIMAAALTSRAGNKQYDWLLPAPQSVHPGSGSLTLGSAPTMAVEGTAESDSATSAAIVQTLRKAIPGVVVSDGKRQDILFKVSKPSGKLSPESYTLAVTPEGITVEAPAAAGLFYGAITLSQLLKEADGGPIEAVAIADTPRLPYRGMMLDVSRHFRDTAFIRKQIDAMASLKLNRLHLHLTDAAGWRPEIKAYPELTRQAAWRIGKTWKEWNAQGNRYSNEADTAATGGYYTRQQMRDLVKYAAARNITIIPEIEMPSHSEEVTAVYPELSCTHNPRGESDFCPGNEATFEFLENVLSEIIDIFPSEYIHIGGDEAPKKNWPDCPLCQKRMADEDIENVEGLQSYLIHRIERWLNDHGRQLIGWDEILEGGLAPNATVMSWRGTEGGEAAAAAGHPVVMTPGRYCYLDGYQDAPYSQPEAIGGYLPLETVYGYDPTAGMKPTVARHIHGLQGNLWCEYIPTAEHAEYMLYPRMYAIAERAWSDSTRRDFTDFRRRAVAFADDMRSRGYNTFDLATEIGNRPEAQKPIHHLAYGKPVTYNRRYWRTYPAGGETALTDGIRGGWNYSDQLWQGFVGGDEKRVDVTIDLGAVTDISSIGADFMQICGPEVFMPAQVRISVSDDGTVFRPLATIDNKVVRDNEVTFKNFGWEGRDRARYVRYEADADPKIGGVLFVDEIVVE